MSDCGCDIEIDDASQKSLLYGLLSINLAMFLIEVSAGWYAESTALMADSLDMLADGFVYGIALYAVGKSVGSKIFAARASGYFQALLGVLLLAEVIRRTVVGSEPLSIWIMGIGTLAMVANIICLVRLRKHRHGDVHMRASWIFSANDVIANVGVIIGGALVWLFDSRWPDLVIGIIISMVILRGAVHILKDAKQEQNRCQPSDSCGPSDCCN